MKLLLLFGLMFTSPVPRLDTGLAEIRALYAKAAFSKNISEKLSLALSKVDTLSEPVLICYKGASEMIEAKYLFNPFSQLKIFNKGKILIELAVKRDTGNLEVRFVRFGIQVNLPSYMKYSNNIEEDKKLLIGRIGTVADPELKKNIVTYLSNPKFCTEEEIKKLKEQ
jgi:hypothetical protein